MLFGLGGHAVSARDLANLDSVVGPGVVCGQFFERGANARFDFSFVSRAGGKHLALHEFDDVIERDRSFGSVNDGFELGFETHKWSLVGCRWSFATTSLYQSLLRA